jgi:hypothetical protein
MVRFMTTFLLLSFSQFFSQKRGNSPQKEKTNAGRRGGGRWCHISRLKI